MTTNCISCVRLTQGIQPRLSEKPHAAIIVTTSGVAFAPDVTNPTDSASKALSTLWP
jgi:uncharacterized oxidoreductase